VQARRVGVELDVVQLSIFAARFMGIAEQMGRTLQRTSVSTNIKERLDFSCALFAPDGGSWPTPPTCRCTSGPCRTPCAGRYSTGGRRGRGGRGWKQGMSL